MNNFFKITRFPGKVFAMRGPNMRRIMCQTCLQEKTHGYRFVELVHDQNDRHLSIFVCDDCLNDARRNK